MKTTTIRVSKEVHGVLAFIGRKGETYDQIIRRLLTHWPGEDAAIKIQERGK